MKRNEYIEITFLKFLPEKKKINDAFISGVKKKDMESKETIYVKVVFTDRDFDNSFLFS